MKALKNLKKKALLMLGSLFLLPAAQAAEPTTAFFEMKANGISYRIFTATPTEAAPENGYPVIYMVDGNRMLPMASKLMAENAKLKAVVVGIGYPTQDKDEIVKLRYFDFTPPTPQEAIAGRSSDVKTGGRDAFFDFIENQVKPEIEKRFHIDTSKQALFGHSLGGLFTLYAMFNHTDRFQTYAAADPSIWWNERSILKDKDRFVKAFTASPQPIRLLVEASGKRIRHPGQTAKDVERIRKLRGGPSGKDVYDELSKLPQMDAAFHRFDDENHGSMIPLSVSDSLNFILLGQNPQKN
ncbi:alpha/beta hydrolase-fold protein [Brucella sp. BE17]|uniref:alpha/beta hydrolase n=1 Tax=Brucella sp. BE17 TaxID=3142977 RepID=UPI0031BA2140